MKRNRGEAKVGWQRGYTWLAANTREIRKKLEVKYKFRQKEIRWWVGKEGGMGESELVLPGIPEYGRKEERKGKGGRQKAVQADSTFFTRGSSRGELMDRGFER